MIFLYKKAREEFHTGNYLYKISAISADFFTNHIHSGDFCASSTRLR